ncbi:hypothetical protein JG687_00004774 [Phytophthora cactorum]|uniref:Uncharacterized protein n=1 Tax=Phytophthora cactorum TaxID=29920 RepID=A0A8T1USC4_9STRA|nr:hypothetical protein GQ600_24264 [Phytophthora cactorum]KAG6966558.1 hypothetical protein JG687_00004774 [Phytophthora cactorum]
MTHEPANAFSGASSASGRAMWKREVANQQSRESSGNGSDAAMARISLPSGEQIHDISKLYLKHCIKDEQRSAHRINQEKARSAREVRSTERQPFDPEHSLARKLTDVPDVVYNTDCGSKKTLERHVADGSNTCRGAFSSTKDRFASTAAYRSSTFASVVKEPYADPQAVGPGTYRAPRRAINVKKKQVPTPAYVSKAARFEEANAQVTAALALVSPTDNSPNERDYMFASSPRGAGGGGHSSPDKVRGPVLSTTPRFKSGVFPGTVRHSLSFCTTSPPHVITTQSERYVSSRQHRIQDDVPDRFYDVSPSCKFSMSAAVASSSFKCSTMQSRANRLSSEAAMVHNTPNFPILTSPTKETVGPGAYTPTSKPRPPEDVNFIMMPHHVHSPLRKLKFSYSTTNPNTVPQADRFGLPNAKSSFIEARFRRFAADPEPPTPHRPPPK